MIIPSNYRQVKTDDTVRKGDIYRIKNRRHGIVAFVHWSIGRKVSYYPNFTFWRPRKTAKVTPSSGASWLPTPAKKQTKSDKKTVTIVVFTYNWKSRRVQLISLDDKYLTGLEITREFCSPYKYQFKKFLRSRIDNHGTIYLSHFGEPLTNG